MIDKSILYLGDGSLATAAGYLAGLMTHWRLGYEHVDSEVTVNGEVETARNLYILSDYGSRMMSPAIQETIVRNVEAGAGLLMIGGWQSFHGHDGEWENTPIARILPVEIASSDDRINCDQPAIVRCLHNHPAIDGLPWDERPPMIGGFNRLVAKLGADVLLDVQMFNAYRNGDQLAFRATDIHPLLIVGRHGQGRVAALATDIAPHWVGGLLDWGTGPRVEAEAPDGWAIEVGSFYAKFLQNLLTWVGHLDRDKVRTEPLVATT